MKMKYTLIGGIALMASIANAAIIQTLPGPFTASGGGDGVIVVDTSNDTGDWIDDLATGTTVFYGFDWTVDDNNGETGGGGFFGGLGLYAGASELVLAGNGWNQLTYTVDVGGGSTADTGIPYVIGTPVRFVAQITTDGVAGGDSLTVWINPTAADFGSPDTFSGGWTLDNTDTFYSRAGNGTGAATMDNIIISDDFTSAIPEPATLGLVTIMGVGIVAARRIFMI